MPINGLGLPCIHVLLAQRDHFLLVARSDHTTRSRNIEPEVVLEVQKMAQYASFCLIMGPFKGGLPVFARLSLVWLPWRALRCRLTLAGLAILGLGLGLVSRLGQYGRPS